MRETWSEVDVIGFCVPADEPVGRGDAFIVNELKAVAGRTPVLGVVTKTDLARAASRWPSGSASSPS